jgi:acetyl esterase/lipase
MKRKWFLSLLIIVITFSDISAQSFSLLLWPDGQMPNFRESGESEIRDSSDIVRIREVQQPLIEVFLPAKRNSTGVAVIICPGGGYRQLAWDWEGTDIAKWLNSKGITAIVLKYRLPSEASSIEPHKTPLLDAQRAMRMVRHHAEEWGVMKNKVGIMGFSAGGHLASTLSTHFDYGISQSSNAIDQQSCRPDFSILMYPVISSDSIFSHKGSFRALLGEYPGEDLLYHYSSEKQVKEDTPPAILIHSANDVSVPAKNSIVYFEALIDKGIPAELHIYPFGGHGFSLALNKAYLSGWTERVMDWLNNLEL